MNAVRAALVNAAVRRLNRLLPARFACPCCGHRAWRFYDHDVVGYVKTHAICPGCGSHEKYRALYLSLRDELPAWPAGAAILHVAPEAPLDRLFARRPDLRRVRLDRDRRDVDVRADLMHLPFRAAAYHHLLVFHVLDYIADDRRALRELRRVTRSGGALDFQVPLHAGVATRELPVPDPLDSFHIRRYGADLFDRVRAAGFEPGPSPPIRLPAREIRQAAAGGGPWWRARAVSPPSVRP